MKKNTLVLVIIALIIFGAIYYFAFRPKLSTNSQPSVQGSNVTTEATAQIKAVLDKLGQHMILPTGEVPQIGQIDDPIQAAKSQPFVSGAQKGDLLIVYVKAQKAIVYSPNRDLIINVGPVSVNPDQNITQTSPSAETATSVKTPTKK